MSLQTFYYTSIETSLGLTPVIASEKEIVWAGVPGTHIDEGRKWLAKSLNTIFKMKNKENTILQQAKQELSEYFKGRNVTFSGPFHLEGTPFQRSVWKEMQAIPYGKTLSYGDVARKIGKPAASRAVGGACRANPIAVFIPCHRIVGSDGSLTGYAGPSKTSIKKTLLAIESNHV